MENGRIREISSASEIESADDGELTGDNHARTSKSNNEELNQLDELLSVQDKPKTQSSISITKKRACCDCCQEVYKKL